MESLTCTKSSLARDILAGLMLSVVLSSNGTGLAIEDTWTYKTDMPTKRLMTGGGVVDGKIHVIGGFPTLNSVTSAVERYDPTTETWSQMSDMPSGRCGPATCTVGGKIYVFGGVHPSPYSGAKRTVFVYDSETDTWTQESDMPYANAWCGIAVVKGIIYLLGGMPSTSSAPIATVMAYDPVTELWTEKADMPTARGVLTACVVDGRIYTIGGTREDWTVFSYKCVEAYDPATDTWTRKSDMPTRRWGMGSCVVDGRIYVVGGRSGGDVCAANEMYDPHTDTWTSAAPMQQKRNGAFVCSIDDMIYAIGGVYLAPHDVFLSVVEEYDTGLGVPSPDLNGDFIVDIEDLILLIEHWGETDPLFDIAPVPFGDNVTDVLDLEHLMSLWGQEVADPTLIAHWKLDETEGDVAYDSAGMNDAVVVGDVLWQPEEGQIGGALLLDGDDDFVSTGPVSNPADGAFSVVAWVLGGAPGQAVMSQADGVNWLCTDSVEGCLMTELKDTGRSSVGPMLSQTNITDGNWHRIGLVWDGLHRTLYVDDVAIAEDTQDGLGGSEGGLYIGTGKAMEPGTYFSGLIDDVRIYSRAVEP